MKKNLFTAITVLAALLTAGCQSDRYYQHRAVERAREFLLEEARGELNAKQSAIVRYNQPFFLSSDVVGVSTWGKADTERRQICITWQLPDSDYLYMVFGVSTGRMDDWYPSRIIRKRFHNRKLAVDSAIDSARKYAVNNLQSQLSPAQLNLVRFQRPWLLKTTFPLSFNPYGSAPAEEIEAARKAAAALVQYSLVWKTDNNNADRIVFCGLSDANLKGWGINFAGLIPAAETDAATAAVVRTPGELEIPLEPAKTADKKEEKK